jgi:hypothetical protein
VNVSTNINSLAVNGILSIGTNNTAYTVTVNGNVVVNGAGTIRPHAMGSQTFQQLLIGGNFTNNGSFLIGSGNPRIHTTFNGSATQTISGSNVAAFYNLTVAGGATVVFPSTNIPTVANIMINSGTVQQTRTVSAATVQFLTITDAGGSNIKYRGVDITTAANLGSVTVSIRAVTGQSCTDTGSSSPPYALRCYEITPTTPGTATVTLWALTSEQNGIPTGNLAPYRYVGPHWILLTGPTNGTGTGNYVFGRGATSEFGNFLLGGNLVPTAVNLNQTAVSLPSNWLLASLIAAMLLLLTGWQVYKHRVQSQVIIPK